MHTTALCSPTRSCILTGRNHHSNGVACIMELATGYPGYDGRMPFENGMLPEMLLEHGYNTFCLGKWHLSPSEDNTPAGPFHRWPLGRGFERFYGFLGGETNQWYPDLTQDNASITQPRPPEEGYHLSEDLADQAIKLILDAHVNAPEKPFFMYYAPGAAHAPHHVPKEWADRYEGKFDAGWDAYRETVFARQKELGLLARGRRALAARPRRAGVGLAVRRRAAPVRRMMEVFAGFVSHADHHFGRILDTLERIGELDNTLIMVISDNGASAEGGVSGSFNEMLFFNDVPESFEENLAKIDELGGTKSYNHYPWGWTWAGNTPFRRWKRETYRGGATDPFILSWPAGIAARGEVRHAVRARDRHGPDRARRARRRAARRRSAASSSRRSRASASRTPSTPPDAATKHTTQYFEMFGHRSIYHDGWRAVCPWPAPNFTEAAQLGRSLGDPITPEVLDQLDREGLGALRHRGATRRSRTTSPPSTRTGCASWSRCGGTRRRSTRCCRSTARCRRGSRPSARRPPSRGSASSTTRAARWCPRSRRRRCSTARTRSRPTSRSRTATPRACWSPRAATPAATRSSSTAGACATSTTTSDATSFELESPDALPEGRHTLRYEFEPTGEPDFTAGQGGPRPRRSSTSTASWWRTPSSRTRRRCSSSSRG